MKPTRSALTIVLSFAAATAAFAADGYVTGDVNLRAGPDPSYPSVATLSAGTSVAIQGCVDGWSWCDVASGDNRGWVAGDFLQEEYGGRRVLVPDYGVQIGIPIVSFVFATYWDNNYRNRSWYSDRSRWSQVRPQYRQTTAHGASRNDMHGSGPTDHRAGDASSKQSIVAQPPRQGVPSNVVTPRRPVAAAPQPEKSVDREKPFERGAPAPKAVTPRPAVVEHKAIQPREAPPKEKAEREGGKDKDKDNKDQH